MKIVGTSQGRVLRAESIELELKLVAEMIFSPYCNSFIQKERGTLSILSGIIDKMRRIFFIRHAKSSWADFNLSDIDRPLNKRGHRDAPFMAEKLSAIISAVDIVICSPARRAQETQTYFLSHIKSKQVDTIQDVYHASEQTLLGVMHGINPECQSALIFGHNPGFSLVYDYFSDDYIDNLPTCGIFELRIDGEWIDSDTTNTTVGHLLYPKLYLS